MTLLVLFDLVTFPVFDLFWRSANNTMTLHRCPLCETRLGVTPQRSLCIGVLHILFPGTLQRFCWLAVWALLQTGVWGRFEQTQDERRHVAIQALFSELQGWYKRMYQEGKDKTRFSGLTLNMLGTPAKFHCKLKAMETMGFLESCLLS